MKLIMILFVCAALSACAATPDCAYYGITADFDRCHSARYHEDAIPAKDGKVLELPKSSTTTKVRAIV